MAAKMSEPVAVTLHSQQDFADVTGYGPWTFSKPNHTHPFQQGSSPAGTQRVVTKEENRRDGSMRTWPTLLALKMDAGPGAHRLQELERAGTECSQEPPGGTPWGSFSDMVLDF